MRFVRLALLPLLAVLLVATATLLPPDDPTPRTPRDVVVDRSAYACPSGEDLTIAAGQVRAGTGASALTLPEREEVAQLQDPTVWRTATSGADAVLVEQEGEGSGPVGTFSGVADDDDGGGLLVGPCPGVVDDAWFAGLGSGRGHQSTLVLTNLADTPAVADVRIWSPEGAVDAVDSTGLVVEPFSTRRVRLADLAAGEPELAVHVLRRRGALAVSALDTATGADAGTSAPTPAAGPTRRQVVGGVVAGGAGRTLHVVNPGDATALVSVEVLGEDGAFTPEGLDELRVGPGSVEVVRVPRSAGTAPLALRLVSNQPVVGAVRTVLEDDLAVVGTSVPLRGPAVVPLDLGTDNVAPRLLLTALEAGATVRLQAFDAQGEALAEATSQLAADTTTELDLGDADVLRTRGAAHVLLRVEGGAVVGAATYRDGGLVDSLALQAAPVTAPGPQVRPAP